MKKHLHILLLLLFANTLYAQNVGINTTGTTPNSSAMLDVDANNKGVLIPRVSLTTTSSASPITTPAISLLVYNTNASISGIGANGVGYYYWDGIKWINLQPYTAPAIDHDWYEVGTTIAPDNINDDMFHTGNVGIGKNTTNYKVDVLEDGNKENVLKIEHTGTFSGSQLKGESVLLNGSNSSAYQFSYYSKHTGTSNNETNGFFHLDSINGNGLHFGTSILMRGSGTGGRCGFNADISTTSNLNHVGLNIGLSGSGSGVRDGIRNFILGTGTGLKRTILNNITINNTETAIGTNNIITGIGNGIHVGTQNEISSNGTGSKYGTRNLMTTSNTGNFIGTENTLTGNGTGTNFLIFNGMYNTSATTTKYGLFNQVSINTDGDLIGVGNNFMNVSSSLKIGMQNFMNTDGNGDKLGVYNSFTGNGNGLVDGVYNIINATGSGDKAGINNTISGASLGNMYGTKSIIYGSSDNEKYGHFVSIPNSSGGTHYGYYASVTKSNSFAAYLLGKVSIGQAASNNYIMPLSRGSNNQIMVTDAIGNVNWQDASTVGDHDWYKETTTSAPNDINNNMFHLGNIAIGKNTASAKLDLFENGNTENVMRIERTGIYTGLDLKGASVYLNGCNSAYQFSYYSKHTGTSDNETNGFFHLDSISGNGLHFGSSIIMTGLGTGGRTAYNADISTTSDVNHVGVNIGLSGSGSGLRDGIRNYISGNGTGLKRNILNSITVTNNETAININNMVIGTGNAVHVGTQNEISSSGTNIHYGTRNLISGTGTGTQYGTENIISNTGTGTHYAGYFLSDGNGNYGIYSTNNSPRSNGGTGYAGYFAGDLVVTADLRPVDNNASWCGDPSQAWNNVYSYTYTTISDQRKKNNIESLNYGLTSLMKLKPVAYFYNDDKENKHRLGFLAQDMQEIVPEAVVKDTHGKSDILGINYTELIPVLTKAIQEQQAQIELQNKTIEELKIQNMLILKKINKLLK